MLHRNANQTGLSGNFTIPDTEGGLCLLKQVMKAEKTDAKAATAMPGGLFTRCAETRPPQAAGPSSRRRMARATASLFLPPVGCTRGHLCHP
jgi:hypothetical protein